MTKFPMLRRALIQETKQDQIKSWQDTVSTEEILMICPYPAWEQVGRSSHGCRRGFFVWSWAHYIWCADAVQDTTGSVSLCLFTMLADNVDWLVSNAGEWLQLGLAGVFRPASRLLSHRQCFVAFQ